MTWIKTAAGCVSSQCNGWRQLEESSPKHCLKTATENVFPHPMNKLYIWNGLLHMDVTSPHALNKDSNWKRHLPVQWIKSVYPLDAVNKSQQLKESPLNAINKGSSWKNLLSMQWIKIAVWRVSFQREVEKFYDWRVPYFKDCLNVTTVVLYIQLYACHPHGKIFYS